MMLNQTTITAIRALILIARARSEEPIPPSEMADGLGASSAYLAKINTQLVKAGLLRAHRGVKGGVTLGRPPESIRLLDIIEACQGRLLGDYCAAHDDPRVVCAFHVAMHEVQRDLLATLGRWTLADLAAGPAPRQPLPGRVQCRMAIRAAAPIED